MSRAMSFAQLVLMATLVSSLDCPLVATMVTANRMGGCRLAMKVAVLTALPVSCVIFGC